MKKLLTVLIVVFGLSFSLAGTAQDLKKSKRLTFLGFSGEMAKDEIIQNINLKFSEVYLGCKWLESRSYIYACGAPYVSTYPSTSEGTAAVLYNISNCGISFYCSTFNGCGLTLLEMVDAMKDKYLIEPEAGVVGQAEFSDSIREKYGAQGYLFEGETETIGVWMRNISRDPLPRKLVPHVELFKNKCDFQPPVVTPSKTKSKPNF